MARLLNRNSKVISLQDFSFLGGKVGLGTTGAPDELLHIESESNARLQIESGDSGQVDLHLRSGISRLNTDASRIFFQAGATTASTIECIAGNAVDVGTLVFKTSEAGGSATEKLRIDPYGRVGIGYATNVPLGVYGNTSSDSTPIVKLLKTLNAGNNTFIQCFINTSTLVGSIRCNGASSNLEFLATSDRRIKEDITPLNGYLEKILTLKPISFKRKDVESEELGYGFTAQEYAEVFPLDVDKTDNGEGEELPEGIESWSMSTGNLPVYLTKAIQELSAKNDALEAENTAMKTKMDELEARIVALENA